MLIRFCLYPSVINGLKDRNAIIHATSYLQLDRATQTVTKMRVERIDKVEPLTEREFSVLFSMYPKMTGDLTTDQCIDIRSGTMADPPRVYIDACCFIDIAKRKIGVDFTEQRAKDSLGMFQNFLKAHKEKDAVVFASVFTIAECLHVSDNVDD